eukprot:428807_1
MKRIFSNSPYHHSESAPNCKRSKLDEKWNEMRASNPYIHFNALPNVPMMQQPHPVQTSIPPSFVAMPSAATAPNLALPNLKSADTFEQLHPGIKAHIQGKQDATSNDNKHLVQDAKSNDNQDHENVLANTDWWALAPQQLLDSYNKPFADQEIDRLYYAVQKYHYDNPRGPFQGEKYWSGIKTFMNTSRTWTSIKTHFNKIVKPSNKGEVHRWSQLVALKAVQQTQRTKRSVNSTQTALHSWADTEKKRRESYEQKKKERHEEEKQFKSKLDKLMDITMERERMKMNSNNNTVPAASVHVPPNHSAHSLPAIPVPVPVQQNALPAIPVPVPVQQNALPAIPVPVHVQQNALPAIHVPVPVPVPVQQNVLPVVSSNTTNTKETEQLFSQLNEFMHAQHKKDALDNTDHNRSLDPVVVETNIGRILASELEEFKDYLDDMEDDALVVNIDELTEIKRLVFGGFEDEKSKKHLARIVTEYQRYSLKYYGQNQLIADKIMKLFRLYQ